MCAPEHSCNITKMLNQTSIKAQGVKPITYKGKALYKTAYDFTMYPMLIYELRSNIAKLLPM